MLLITYQVAVVHLDMLETLSFCVRERNKCRKIRAVFAGKMLCVESVKMEYQCAHVYQE